MIRDESEQLRLRLRQTAQRAERMGIPVCGRFLAAEERTYAEQAARENGVTVAFDGGYEDAERVQPCFCPDWAEPEYTGQWVQVGWNDKFVHVSHSDLLGSLMALGMDRSFIGDIVLQDGCAWVMAMPEMAVRLPMEWQKAGNAPIRVTMPQQPPVIQPKPGTMLRDTVPSLRLDCILAAGLKLSRARASEMIRQGIVMVDHRPQLRTDRQLTEGSLLSIRHYGRIRVTDVGDPTRKDRLPVTLQIFTR